MLWEVVAVGLNVYRWELNSGIQKSGMYSSLVQSDGLLAWVVPKIKKIPIKHVFIFTRTARNHKLLKNVLFLFIIMG